MRYQIVLDSGGDGLFRYNENWKGEDVAVVARPKTEDPEELTLDMRAVASEWFAAPAHAGTEPMYWHDSPELTGSYAAHRQSGHTVHIETREEVS